MKEYTIQPWPSKYGKLGKVASKVLVSRFGRRVGAFRTAIPACTIEPPQVHLCNRYGKSFEELLTDFDKTFHVAFLDPITRKTDIREYSPGQNIVIPEYVVHWLMNANEAELKFTCEFSPFPWKPSDEPEFRNLDELLRFADEKGIRQKLRRML